MSVWKFSSENVKLFQFELFALQKNLQSGSIFKKYANCVHDGVDVLVAFK